MVGETCSRCLHVGCWEPESNATFPLKVNRLQRSLAGDLGWTPARLNTLIKGRRGVTADAALDQARVLKTSPEVWLSLQMLWDLKQAEQRRAN